MVVIHQILLQEFAGFTEYFYLCTVIYIIRYVRTNVILSIRPNFCQAIFNGSKVYEYRKRVFKSSDVDKVYIYASKPISRIVGYFTIKRVIDDTPSTVWNLTHKFGGISKKYFLDYFEGLSAAYAIEIDEVVKLDTPIDPKSIIEGFTAPQNYCYLDKDL